MILNRLRRTAPAGLVVLGALVLVPLTLAKPKFIRGDIILDGVDELGNRSTELGTPAQVKIKLIRKGFIAIAHANVENLSGATQKYRNGDFEATLDTTTYSGTEKSYVVTKKGRANLVAKGSDITEVEPEPEPEAP